MAKVIHLFAVTQGIITTGFVEEGNEQDLGAVLLFGPQIILNDSILKNLRIKLIYF